MQASTLSITLCALFFSTAAFSAEPYAGEETREIKSLSPQEISNYLEGKGAGMAKAAELNHYPGPAHVLELAQALALSETQIRSTQSLFNAMQQGAQRLGKTLVEKEQALDQAFAQKSINRENLKILLDQIGLIQAGIRLQHLQAHLEQASILSEAQRLRYDQLRGYQPGSAHKSTHAH